MQAQIQFSIVTKKRTKTGQSILLFTTQIIFFKVEKQKKCDFLFVFFLVSLLGVVFISLWNGGPTGGLEDWLVHLVWCQRGQSEGHPGHGG